MSDSDLISLYSKRILALASDISHHERLETPAFSSKKRSPLCGSTVTVDVELDEAGRISAFGQDVKACALGQASASIFAQNVIGRDKEEIATLVAELRAMLKEEGPIPNSPFEGYEVLLPAREYRNRHASILLAPEATLEALSQEPS